ncbi:hypothetical protein [Anaeromyxobacter paludicola]|uniref:Uncharacterized protein n=1 Tax=Anaeromyxobacter paludicola TaxID=2918171 RepID=A0ABM7X8V1_9BACT|nr:hypothetical protein [Anaeromyxobacter paludicola]BDG08215.1 hypothetical protein AMPC_13280 [Anaeromyxobacter paludicola]
MPAKCDCERSVEGNSERHSDGTVTFHTFAGCLRVKPCEHIKKQSDISLIGPDGRCTKCPPKDFETPAYCMACGKDMRTKGEDFDLNRYRDRDRILVCRHCGAENAYRLTTTPGVPGQAIELLWVVKPR